MVARFPEIKQRLFDKRGKLLGYVDNKVDVLVRGGLLQVEWDGKGEVLLSGPAEIVFEGQWPE